MCNDAKHCYIDMHSCITVSLKWSGIGEVYDCIMSLNTYACTHTALNEQHLPSQYNLPCGIIAGVMSTLITQPADVIKTRMQIQPQEYPTIFTTIGSVVRDRGLKGLFIGTLPRTTRRTLMAAFTWAFYEEVCKLLIFVASLQHEVCSCFLIA